MIFQTINGFQNVHIINKSKYIFDVNKKTYVSLRPIPENLLFITQTQLPKDKPIPKLLNVLGHTPYYIYTTEGIKHIYSGIKGGKYILFDGVYINIKKLPEYSVIIMSPPKSKFEKFLDLFKKKPPSPNTTQSPKKDYQLIAKQVYTFLLKNADMSANQQVSLHVSSDFKIQYIYR